MKKKIWLSILAAVAVLAILAGVIALASRGAINAIERQRHDIIGLAIDVKDYSINLLSATLVLSDIKIYPAGKEDEEHLLAKADKLKIALAPRDLLKKTLHARKIILLDPVINVTKETRTDFNWGVVDLGGNEKKAEAEVEDKGEKWQVWVDSVKVSNAEITYKDKVEGHRIRLTKLDMQISDIIPGRPSSELPTQLKIDARIDGNKGGLDVRGRLNLFARGINFKIRSVINNTPITYYSSFYAGKTPFPIVGGSVSLTSQATSKESELLAQNHASIYNLKAGGGLKGDLINAYVLSQRAPIEVDVTVRGNLEEGDISVGSKVSAGISEGILAQARSVPNLLGVPLPVPSAPKNVGEGLRKIFRR